MVELSAENSAAYENFVRIDPHMFQELLHVVGSRITTKTTWYRQSIDPGLRLAITLYYLATGDRYRTLMVSGLRTIPSVVSFGMYAVSQAVLLFIKQNRYLIYYIRYLI